MIPQDEKLADEALDKAQMVTDDQKDLDLPEAPASVTIRVWIKGYGVMLTARDNKVASLLKKTETMIDYAESHGWKNTWDTNIPATTSQPTTLKPPSKGQPTCSLHGNSTKWIEGVSKKTGKKYAFWSCQERVNGQYCEAELIYPE